MEQLTLIISDPRWRQPALHQGSQGWEVTWQTVPFHAVDMGEMCFLPTYLRKVQNSWTFNSFNTRVTGNPVPFAQTQWPNPNIGFKFDTRNITNIGTFSFALRVNGNPVPFHQLSWPLPNVVSPRSAVFARNFSENISSYPVATNAPHMLLMGAG